MRDNNQGFTLNAETGYFQYEGVNVLAFDNVYPEGHQSGVGIIMHGNRIATNGDVRFEQTPGQWQPVPKQGCRAVDVAGKTITTELRFPNASRHLKGFNPMIYPDFVFDYTVSVKASGESVVITADLDQPVPDAFLGKVCFNMELFPGALMGKPWIMDNKQGIFPNQPNGPVISQPANYHTGNLCSCCGEGSEPLADIKRLSGDGKAYNPIIADDWIAKPYAVGKRFTVCPDDPYNRFTVESNNGDIKLYDGRMNHNNGWFVISAEIPKGATTCAVQWVITPNIVKDWRYAPVIQVSQVGYHPNQPKVAVIELDDRESAREKPVLYTITETGEERVLSADAREFGRFLRYNYIIFDFSEVIREGLYKIRYDKSESSVFRIARDVYERGIWQPVLEYFLPVQMCHMKVSEKYRVWHGLCHNDDARMAPLNLNHFDGYVQGSSTLSKYKPGEAIPGLNTGGWHDAGDFDLRIESQAGEVYILSMAYEAFNVYYDATTIDQAARVTEIHQPDGKNDILQQIEHGTLSIIGAYNALGRFYRGIIANDLRQYVLLGDSSAMTDGIKGNGDDRWLFTTDDPAGQLSAAAHMAAAARVLKGFNNGLSEQALAAARAVYASEEPNNDAGRTAKIHAAAELFLTTGEEQYQAFLLSETEYITQNIEKTGWFIARAEKAISNPAFTKAIRNALPGLKNHYDAESAKTPYNIPYHPHLWGAGWDAQRLGYRYYFLHSAYPDIFPPDTIFNALNFVLGCHPGSNNISFASGIGTKSATVGYGLNRADWSYIPGGVISGTALIRPDFPELLTFPFLWQQVEYVIGGGSSHFMFLVLAATEILKGFNYII